MQLRYNYRLYPTAGQRKELAKAFGCARVVFNDALRARRETHAAGLPYIKDTDLQKQVITAAKRTEERGRLAEVSSVVLVQALADPHTAYRNFFASVTGKRRAPHGQGEVVHHPVQTQIPPHRAAPSTRPRDRHSGWTVRARPHTGHGHSRSGPARRADLVRAPRADGTYSRSARPVS
ncbi:MULTISPECIES: helix-turn-helix domain-containing protein [unclassified Streptomyces]|uniref:helix-turn-helix domain-containing protein n=1 Tax=unclassified Streptomyces TaxID=2593676 RepID=UPI00190415DD